MITEQERKLYKIMARKETRHRKVKFLFRFWSKISKWWFLAARQIQTSRLGKTCLTLRGEMAILVSKINKYHFLYIILLIKIKRNIVILATHFLVKKNPKKRRKELNLGLPSSGHSIHFWWHWHWHMTWHDTWHWCAYGGWATTGTVQANVQQSFGTHRYLGTQEQKKIAKYTKTNLVTGVAQTLK